MDKKGFTSKEQVIMALLFVCGAAFFQLNKTVGAHMLDCARRSATVEKIGYGILVIVAAGLIMNGINSYHNGGDSMHRTEVVEEKHTAK